MCGSFARTLALLALGGAALGQGSHLSVTMNGFTVQFFTLVEPPGDNPGGQLPGGVLVGNGRAHHIIDDAANRRYFAYDLRIEPAADGNSATLRIEPLSDPKLSGRAGSVLVAPLKYPVIPGIRPGDTVAMDLLVNRATGQKIVEYLTLSRAAGPEPHDFSMADIQLQFLGPQVRINGALEPATIGYKGGILAPVVWFYLPGRGRYLMSLWPNPSMGFQKNGKIEGDTMIFRDGAAEYRVQCTGAIAPGSGVYNLYVLRQPEWRAPDEVYLTGGADKAEYIVK